MTRIHLLRLLALLVGALALAPFGVAQAKEIVGVTIAGPTLPRPVERADPDAIAFATNLRFEEALESPPANLGPEFYELRIAVGDAGEIFAANIWHYYPPQAGDIGYIYYADVIGGSSTAEGDWFALSPRTTAMVDEFIASLASASSRVPRLAFLPIVREFDRLPNHIPTIH